METRKRLGKRARFEVFKRDKFTCQYCGRAAPDVTLHIDHIKPVSEGGTDDFMNLITSCQDCNLGKSNIPLSDQSALAKQKAMMDSLQDRREQLELMMEWQRGLAAIDDEMIDSLAGYWNDLTPGWCLSDHGIVELRKLLKKHEPSRIMNAMRVAAGRYLEGDIELEQWDYQEAWLYVGRVCAFEKRNKDKPWMKDLFYIRGIMRNRFAYVNDWRAIQLLKDAQAAGADLDVLREQAVEASSWSEWQDLLAAYMSELETA